jgi:hypothetical protein
MEQINEHNLPSIPAKPKDPRHDVYVKARGSKCWELDALEPRTLRDILKREVEAFIDWDSWNEAKEVEREERVRGSPSAMGRGLGPALR